MKGENFKTQEKVVRLKEQNEILQSKINNLSDLLNEDQIKENDQII